MHEDDTAAIPAGNDEDPRRDEGDQHVAATAAALERLETASDGLSAEPLVAETGMKDMGPEGGSGVASELEDEDAGSGEPQVVGIEVDEPAPAADGPAAFAAEESYAEREAAGVPASQPPLELEASAPPDAPEPEETSETGIEQVPDEVVAPVEVEPAASRDLFAFEGRELYFESWGDDGAPAVIAIHEAGQDLRSWWPVLRALGGDYRLVGIDLPGHGRSPSAEPGSWATGDIAEHAAALLDSLGIHIAAVAGYGLGARIAMELAARHPQVIAAVVVADLVPSEGSWTAYPPDPAEDVVTRHGPRELGKRLGAGIGEHFYRRGLRTRYERMDRDGLLGALVALREPARELQVKCPVLVCVGDADGALAESKALASSLPASRLLRFRDTERPVVHSRPEEFGEQVYRFLRAVEEGATVSGERTI